MPNDVATASWTELPVAFAAEPAMCVGLIALANDGTIEADVHDYLRAPDIRICTTRVRTPLRNTLASLSSWARRWRAPSPFWSPRGDWTWWPSAAPRAPWRWVPRRCARR